MWADLTAAFISADSGSCRTVNGSIKAARRVVSAATDWSRAWCGLGSGGYCLTDDTADTQAGNTNNIIELALICRESSINTLFREARQTSRADQTTFIFSADSGSLNSTVKTSVKAARWVFNPAPNWGRGGRGLRGWGRGLTDFTT